MKGRNSIQLYNIHNMRIYNILRKTQECPSLRLFLMVASQRTRTPLLLPHHVLFSIQFEMGNGCFFAIRLYSTENTLTSDSPFLKTSLQGVCTPGFVHLILRGRSRQASSGWMEKKKIYKLHHKA